MTLTVTVMGSRKLSCHTLNNYYQSSRKCTTSVMDPCTKTSRLLQIFVITVMTLDWIANGISLRPAMKKKHIRWNWRDGQAFKVTGMTDLVSETVVWLVCVCNIQHITFFFVTAADVDSQRALLDDRFVLLEPSHEHEITTRLFRCLTPTRRSAEYQVKTLTSLRDHDAWMSQLSKVP